MKPVLVLLISALSLAIYSREAVGQDLAELRAKASEAVRSKLRDAELVLEDEREREVSYNWRFGEKGKKKGVTIVIFFGESKVAAAARMKFANKFLPLGPGKRLTGLGDEAYYSESVHYDFAVIRFRKANVFIKVDAPTLAMADSLARELLKSIKERK